MPHWAKRTFCALVLVVGAATAMGGRPQPARLEVVWVHDLPGVPAEVCLWPEGDDAPGVWQHEGPEVVADDGIPRPRLVELRDRERLSTYRPTTTVIHGESGDWQLYARVVESWRHQFDARRIDRLEFLADGRLAGAGESTWSRREGRLVLRWPDGRAPGGAWVDDCAGEKDGDTYDGWNQCGTRIVGTRIRD
jgi:hypothetical protein